MNRVDKQLRQTHLTYFAAAGNAAQTTAVVPNGASGDVTSIVITVSDEFGNPVIGAAGDLDVSCNRWSKYGCNIQRHQR